MLERETAETIALRALAWLAADDERLGHFLGATGVQGRDLAERAKDVDFLGFVLDFLLMDDGAVIAFCEAEGLNYETPREARAALPGGAVAHWT